MIIRTLRKQLQCLIKFNFTYLKEMPFNFKVLKKNSGAVNEKEEFVMCENTNI